MLKGMAEHVDPRDLLISTRVRRLEGGEPPHRDPDLARIRRGYFKPRAAQLSDSDDYRLRILATAAARQGPLTFSHTSAAELWGCPLMRSDLGYVHATQPGLARRTTAGVRIHRSAIPDGHVVELPDGLCVTSREWTAVELAATGAFPQVLLPLDFLVREIAREHGSPQDDVRAALVALVPKSMKGRERAQRHLALADGRSGSAGESLSRGQMVLLRVPMPDLQVAFARGEQPGDDIVDFDWPELERFGEFDGEGKYFRREFAGDRTPAQVLWEEKQREDRIRRHRPQGVRWGWRDALSRERLGRILAQAGIRPAA